MILSFERIPSRSKKPGRFEKIVHFDSSHPIVTRSPRALPHYTLPAFLSLNGTKSFSPIAVLTYKLYIHEKGLTKKIVEFQNL